MDVELNSRELILRLEEEEWLILQNLQKPTKNFYDLHIQSPRDPSKTAFRARTPGARFIFLGYSNSAPPSGLGDICYPLENFGTFGSSNHVSIPWLINLTNKGKEYIELGWPLGIMYNGTHKLFIFKPKPI